MTEVERDLETEVEAAPFLLPAAKGGLRVFDAVAFAVEVLATGVASTFLDLAAGLARGLAVVVEEAAVAAPVAPDFDLLDEALAPAVSFFFLAAVVPDGAADDVLAEGGARLPALSALDFFAPTFVEAGGGIDPLSGVGRDDV
jgi:hypothetical protein